MRARVMILGGVVAMASSLFTGPAADAAAGTTSAGRGSGVPCASSTPYLSGTAGYASFRIPAVVRTRAGTLLAFAEGRHASSSDAGDIDIVLRRSSDGGCTWGPLAVVAAGQGATRGNPAPAVDSSTGEIVLVSSYNAGDATEAAILRGEVSAADSRRVFVQTSRDDGTSFTAPREITATTKLANWRWYATGPGHATVLRGGRHDGRIVVPANHSIAPPAGSSDTGAEAKYYGGHDLYSDDHGRTWHIGYVDDNTDGVINVNESSATQLTDGRLYFNARDQNGTSPATRADAYSVDGGRTLVRPFAAQPSIAGPVVQGSVLQVPGGPLLYSGPADPNARAKMTLRQSTDAGRTWHPVLQVSDQLAAYSDLVALDRNTAGLLYETGTKTSTDTIVFTRIPVGHGHR